MSAYIVENSSINRVVTYLFRKSNHHYHYTFKQLKGIGIDQLASDWMQSLGETMHSLNCIAVSARYGRTAESAYKLSTELSEKMQVFKSLRCWLYQCTEGDVPELPLYKIMEDLSNTMALEIISDMPEFKQAEWA